MVRDVWVGHSEGRVVHSLIEESGRLCRSDSLVSNDRADGSLASAEDLHADQEASLRSEERGALVTKAPRLPRHAKEQKKARHSTSGRKFHFRLESKVCEFDYAQISRPRGKEVWNHRIWGDFESQGQYG